MSYRNDSEMLELLQEFLLPAEIQYHFREGMAVNYFKIKIRVHMSEL